MEKRRIVLVPLPAHGHITPMMQLGKALSLKGFSITVVNFNQVSSSQHLPGFKFVTIAESFLESELVRVGPTKFLLKFNKTSKECFKDFLQQGNDIACIIYDELLYFCEAAAKELKLACIIFNTSSATNLASLFDFIKLDTKKFLVDMEDLKVHDKVVENLNLFRYKDIVTWGLGPLEELVEFYKEVVKKRTASAVIINTASCLETTSLSWLQQKYGIPVYPLGLLDRGASANSSFLEEDRSCINWLNKQKPRSVMYISMGSTKDQMETKEVLEMAWGLCNSNQPFLWVIRKSGSNGLESLPEEVSKLVSERGYIVKWAPQIEVLRHPAVGGFWSHCGWNSTLQTIAEGIPVICRPFQGEQKLNAMYIESVWSVGIQLEGEVERGMVERAVKRLIVEEEGACLRKRAFVLKEKLSASIENGGFTYNALAELVNFLETK